MGIAGATPSHGGGDLLVPIRENSRFDYQLVARDAFGGKSTAVDARRHVFDAHATASRSEESGLVVVPLCVVHGAT
jgi:hypothetical protein